MLKKSGITRKIDELGRIVVPKEIRYNLGIREGDNLEIFVEDNKIIIDKFSQLDNYKPFSEKLCLIIKDVFEVDVVISDRERIIVSTKNIDNGELTSKHKELIDGRESYQSKVKETYYNIDCFWTIIPIITTEDSSGLVMICNNKYHEDDIKYAKIIQKLLVQKIDIAS